MTAIRPITRLLKLAMMVCGVFRPPGGYARLTALWTSPPSLAERIF